MVVAKYVKYVMGLHALVKFQEWVVKEQVLHLLKI